VRWGADVQVPPVSPQSVRDVLTDPNEPLGVAEMVAMVSDYTGVPLRQNAFSNWISRKQVPEPDWRANNGRTPLWRRGTAERWITETFIEGTPDMHKCVCGYTAKDQRDLEEHILTMVRMNDRSDHAEGR